jgi:hypothetical protein
MIAVDSRDEPLLCELRARVEVSLTASRITCRNAVSLPAQRPVAGSDQTDLNIPFDRAGETAQNQASAAAQNRAAGER